MTTQPTTEYYLIFCYEDVTPETHGPYPSEDDRDEVARYYRHIYGKDHGIYWLDITGGRPETGSFTGGHMDLEENPIQFKQCDQCGQGTLQPKECSDESGRNALYLMCDHCGHAIKL